MIIDTDNLVPITNVNLGYIVESKIRTKGYVVIVKNDKPTYLMLDISNERSARKAMEQLERLQKDF